MITAYFKDNDDFMVDDNYKSFVRIEKFNDSSIDILVICFTSTKDWDKYLEIKEELAIKIKENVEKIVIDKNVVLKREQPLRLIKKKIAN